MADEYWQKRADARMAGIQSDSDEVIMEVREAYDEAVGQLNADIKKLFFRFAGKNGLTSEDAKKLLNEQLTASEVREIRSRIETIQDDDIRKQLLTQLDATITRSRISRMEALREDIYIQMSRVADVELHRTTARYVDIMRDEFLHSTFDFQQYLGMAYSFSMIPMGTVKEILKEDWSGKHYSRRLWENAMTNGTAIEDTVRRLLLRGTLTGTNSRKIAHELDSRAHVGMYACERLVRTEGTYFTAMADLEAAKERGTEEMKFVATLDSRTSPECREHDGSIVRVSEAVPGKNIPPLHPFCRSVMIDVIKGLIHKVRTARDPETGKNYKVPADMTYQEWEKKYVDSRVLLGDGGADGWMGKSSEAFSRALDENDDTSNIFTMMRMCRDNATFKEDRTMDVPYAYHMESDEFRYNPAMEHFRDYDMNFVLAHELGHRLDATWCHSWENGKFLEAIEITRKKLLDNPDTVLSWLTDGGKYHDEPAIHDIVSALFKGERQEVTGHAAEYWNSSPETVPMEIFANMVYIRTMKPSSIAEASGFLTELFRVMEGMI